jgi:hypothetical protein
MRYIWAAQRNTVLFHIHYVVALASVCTSGNIRACICVSMGVSMRVLLGDRKEEERERQDKWCERRREKRGVVEGK